MAVRVNIEASAWGDKRFALLARFIGFADADHALIKCASLWSWQTENYSPSTPTYVVDADTIDVCLGKDGSGAAMVRAGLAEEHPDGYRIRGSEGRIEWYWNCRQNAAQGVAARRAKAESSRDRPVHHPVDRPVDDCNADNKQQPTGQPPGEPNRQPTPQPNRQPSLLFVPEAEEKRKAASRKTDSQARRPVGKPAQVIAHWNTRFEKVHGTRPFWSPAVQRLVDGLVKQFDPGEICRRIDIAFDTPPTWPAGPYDFDTFARHFDKFLRAPPRPGAGTTSGVRPILTREQRERISQESARGEEESA